MFLVLHASNAAVISVALATSQLGSPPPATAEPIAEKQQTEAIVLKRSPTAAEGADITPSDVAQYLKKYCFGPPNMLERDGDRVFATVPVRVVLADGPKVEVEFERRIVVEPLTKDQLPTRVAIVSRFKDGTERAGAFLRNPTTERIVHLYQTTVSKVTYWEGHGFFVSVIGNGPVWVCGSGGFSGNIVDENGKIVATVPPPRPPEPRYDAGHHEPEPMPRTSDAPVHYCENAPTITTLTPTFVFPSATQGNKLHVFVQTVGWMDVCEGQDLPITTREVKVPAGVLEPGRSYDLLVSARGALGSSSITSYRFHVAEKDKLSGGEGEVTFTPAQGRGEQ